MEIRRRIQRRAAALVGANPTEAASIQMAAELAERLERWLGDEVAFDGSEIRYSRNGVSMDITYDFCAQEGMGGVLLFVGPSEGDAYHNATPDEAMEVIRRLFPREGRAKPNGRHPSSWERPDDTILQKLLRWRRWLLDEATYEESAAEMDRSMGIKQHLFKGHDRDARSRRGG